MIENSRLMFIASADNRNGPKINNKKNKRMSRSHISAFRMKAPTKQKKTRVKREERKKRRNE